MKAIETRSLRKEFKGIPAVESLDLTVEEGELYALLGVNGAGKTTTIKMLTALTRPTSGDALVYGHSVTDEPNKVKELIDVSMQETAIARKLTVEENIAFYARLSGQKPEEIAKTKQTVYSVFGLQREAKKQAGKLSGGWQRKLSIALALVTKPKVLFLDEPTLGLDVLARRELWNTITALKGQMTIVLTTHYMEEAEALADRIGVMKEGSLLFSGTKEELFGRTGKSNVEDAFIELVTGGEEHA
ncbi:MAG: ABC transporter ATP-binding protein [Clostridia bacterium]|nr:ABC transporter ATP-binding protein [Clostridia bacterium]